MAKLIMKEISDERLMTITDLLTCWGSRWKRSTAGVTEARDRRAIGSDATCATGDRLKERGSKPRQIEETSVDAQGGPPGGRGAAR